MCAFTWVWMSYECVYAGVSYYSTIISEHLWESVSASNYLEDLGIFYSMKVSMKVEWGDIKNSWSMYRQMRFIISAETHTAVSLWTEDCTVSHTRSWYKAWQLKSHSMIYRISQAKIQVHPAVSHGLIWVKVQKVFSNPSRIKDEFSGVNLNTLASELRLTHTQVDSFGGVQPWVDSFGGVQLQCCLHQDHCMLKMTEHVWTGCLSGRTSLFPSCWQLKTIPRMTSRSWCLSFYLRHRVMLVTCEA